MTPLETLLRSERQWPKHLRIQHAKYQIKVAATLEEQSIWKQVLQANIDTTERSERERPKPAKSGTVKFKGPATKRLSRGNGN